MKNSSITTIVGITAILSTTAGAMNLLTNPSFEDGAASATFSSSTEFGGADALELTSPSSEIPGWVWEQTQGSTGGAAWLEEAAGDIFGTDGSHLLFLDPQQCIQWQGIGTAGTAVAGDEFQLDYNFASWTRAQDNSSASGGDSTILLEFNYFDTNDEQQFGSYDSNIVAPDNGSAGPGALVWIDGSYVFEIPADYGSDFNFLITNTGGLLVDDLSISVVPEPGTATLFGLTLIGMAMRRRR